MIRDLLWALRSLRRKPLFTAAICLILALGIGANTAVFSVVNAVLLRPLPGAGALVRIDETRTKWLISGVPGEDYLRWRDRSDLFEQTAPYVRDTVTVTGGSEPDQVVALRASGKLFTLLNARARLGRTLAPSDDRADAANVAVLSDRLWHRRFHADPSVIGRTIRVSDEVFTVAGVMPSNFEFQYPTAEMWLPLRLTPPPKNLLQVVGRLRRGVTAAQAEAALQAVAREMEREDPHERAGLRILVSKWTDTPDRSYALTLILVLAAVALVLLIACADVGGLLLSRAVERQREVAIRASLGAGTWRIARQLLAESFVCAALGSVAGVVSAYFVLKLLSRHLRALPIVLPHLSGLAVDARVLLFSAAVCLLIACLCGVAPVLLACRTDLESALRTGQGGGVPKQSRRLFAALIASQAGLAFLLLVGSGLMIRSLVRLQSEDHGIRPDHVLTMRVPVGSFAHASSKYDTRPRQMAYYRELIERLQRVPGIRSVAVVNNLPLSDVNTTTALKTPAGVSLGSTRTVSPQYFAVMGIALLAGRVFTDQDKAGSRNVAIINQYLARQLFPNRNPLGEPLPEPGTNFASTVVGVVADSPQRSYDQPAKGEMYRPYQQFIFAAFMSTVVARTYGDPLSVASAMRREIWAVDPSQPVVKIETMDDVIADSIWRPRFSAWILSALAVLALLLTCAGVYSIVTYTAALRAREAAIRVALGATPANIVAIVVRDAMAPLIAGLAVSAVAAVFLTRLLASLLYEIRSSDPTTYVGAALVLLAIGAAASARPAWKAAVSDPVQALRTE